MLIITIPITISVASIIALAVIIYDDFITSDITVPGARGVASILTFAVCLMGNVLMWAIWENLK